MRARNHEEPRRVPAGHLASSPDEIELVEMANLSSAQTGVEGVIYIPTAQGRHGARVKWYPDRPSQKAPCLSVTIEEQPRVFNHHLPKRIFEAASGPVEHWTALNHAALLDFWNNGNTWLDDEVTAFKRALRKSV